MSKKFKITIITLIFIALLIILWFVPIIPIYDKISSRGAECEIISMNSIKDLIEDYPSITVWVKNGCTIIMD